MVNIKSLNILSAILSFMILSGCREKYVEEPEVIDFGSLTGKIAIARDNGKILIIDFENKTTSVCKPVHGEPFFIWDYYVSLSPDGETIALAIYYDEGYQICSVPAAGGGISKLTGNTGDFTVHSFYPVWSTDGNNLFYSTGSSVIGGPVLRMTSTGSDIVQVTDQMAFGRASVSDDCKNVVFSISPYEAEYTKGIYSLNTDTETLTLLMELDSTENCLCPVISPDGTKIACILRHGINEYGDPPFYFRIVVMNIDGSGEHTVKSLPFNNYFSSAFITWSPDGSRLAFNAGSSVTDEYIHLYVIKTDGSDLLQITDIKDHDGAPSWVE